MSFRKLSVVTLAVLAIGACGSPPPSAVDEELLFVDIEACAHGDASCEQSGSTAPAELLLEGDHGLMLLARADCVNKSGETKLCEVWTDECCASKQECVKAGTCGGPTVPPAPAKITLPILGHHDDARLAWIAIGMTSGGLKRTLRLKIDGQEETIIQPSAGYARLEVSGREQLVPAGARLELTADDGIFGIAWIVGRWKR